MRKEFFKEIKNTFGQFMSILLIVALGVGFFAGIRATGPDFRETADEYFKETKFMDLQVEGNYGLTEKDIEAIRNTEGVEMVEAAYQYDALFDHNGEAYVVRFRSYTDGNDGVNGLQLLEGRLPENPGEAVIKETNGKELSNPLGKTLLVGDTFTVYSGKADEELSEGLGGDTYEIVGVVRSPQYIISLTEATDIGAGSVNAEVFVTPDNFTMDYYTTAFVKGTELEELPFYEDQYETIVTLDEEQLESVGEVEGPRRLAELTAENQDKIDDAQKELDDAKADAQIQLDDARVQLDDAQKKLQDGEQEYADGKREFDEEIADAEQQLADGKQTLEDGEKEYADGWAEYSDGAAEYRAAERNASQSLPEAKAQLEAAKAQLDTAKAQLDASKTELDAGWQQIAAGEEQLAQGKAALEQAIQLETLLNSVLNQGAYFTPEQSAQAVAAASAYDSSLGMAVEAHLQAVQAGISSPTSSAISGAITALNDEISTGQTQITESEAVLTASRAQLEQGQAQYDAGYAQYLEGLNAYNLGMKEYTDGIAQLMSAEEQLKEARQKLDDARQELDDGWKEYNENYQKYLDAKAEGEQKLVDAEQELADGRVTLADAEVTYNEKKQEFDDTVAENQAKIDDARQDLEDFLEDSEASKWTVTTRLDTNQVVQYMDTTKSMDTISTIFPVFFLVIAVLVCLTTMTRMVEERRGQIGTLKALGYSKPRIVAKYLIYAAVACIVGSIIGLLIGFQLFPRVIYGAYSTMMYQLPPISPPFRWSLAIGTTLVATLCILVATYSVCYSSLKEEPAALMRPKAPPKGKRIVLERIGFLWNRFNFTWKVTMRNLFRYKKRMFMTILGIAGCTALMLTGFGLRDEVSDIIGLQFSDINHTHLTVVLNNSTKPEDVAEYQNMILENGDVKTQMVANNQSTKISASGGKEDATLVVPSDMEAFPTFITLQNSDTKEGISLSDAGVVLSEKLAKLLNVVEGEEVTLEVGDQKTVTTVVDGIAENYAFHYIYMSPTLYESLYNEAPDYRTGYIILNEGMDTEENENRIAGQIMEQENVLTVTTTISLFSMMNDQISSINTVIVVLVISAALLAFVVMYNLSSININERTREIATIKLLGFYNNEVSDYVFRETLILSVVGTVVGLFLGIYLVGFVSATAEPNMIMFGQEIKPLSFLYSAVLTMAFTFIVQAVSKRILKRIDMIDSLKSVE